MNFLAHLYLSGSSDRIKIGNFIGDYVKGKNYENYPDDIKYGILLHRKIDTFTDSHIVVKQSKDHFLKKYHKYAGVITDVVYDHFLTIHWEKYSKLNLKQFIFHAYHILLSNYSSLPARVKQFLPFFVIYNWLGSYDSLKGLERVFDRMSEKTSLPKYSKYAIYELHNNYNQIQNDFLKFFPELIDFVLEDNKVKLI